MKTFAGFRNKIINRVVSCRRGGSLDLVQVPRNHEACFVYGVDDPEIAPQTGRTAYNQRTLAQRTLDAKNRQKPKKANDHM